MKKPIIIFMWVSLLIMGLVLSGCDIMKPKVSISGRLDSFTSHLTNDRANINADFRVGSTGYASGDTYVVGYEVGTYSIASMVTTGTSVSGTIYCTNAGFGTRTFTATLDYDSDGNAVLVTMSITGKTPIPA